VKILITGATGFIGSHLVPRLSRVYDVFAVVRTLDSVPPGEKVSRIVADLSRPVEPASLPDRMDVIIHLAQANASFPEHANELFAVNTTSTQQMLDYARRAGAGQFILASTGDVYGKRVGTFAESDPIEPASYYAVTKRAAENLMRAYSDYFSACIFRFFHPYGPGQSGRLIPKLAARIRQKEAILLNEKDKPLVTPTFVDDIVYAVERAIECRCSGTLNIAGDETVSIRELAEQIGVVIGTDAIFKSSGKDSGDMIGDNRLMKQTLGEWRMIPLSDGLARSRFIERGDEEDARWQARV